MDQRANTTNLHPSQILLNTKGWLCLCSCAAFGCAWTYVQVQLALCAVAQFAFGLVVLLQATQPLLEHNGMLKWALDNVAHSESPPCKSALQEVRDQWSSLEVMSTQGGINPKAAMAQYFTPLGGSSATWVGTGGHIQVGGMIT